MRLQQLFAKRREQMRKRQSACSAFVDWFRNGCVAQPVELRLTNCIRQRAKPVAIELRIQCGTCVEQGHQLRNPLAPICNEPIQPLLALQIGKARPRLSGQPPPEPKGPSWGLRRSVWISHRSAPAQAGYAAAYCTQQERAIRPPVPVPPQWQRRCQQGLCRSGSIHWFWLRSAGSSPRSLRY